MSEHFTSWGDVSPHLGLMLQMRWVPLEPRGVAGERTDGGETCAPQIVNLIEETGHFHITNTTFDFDLCSLDRTTVRKLQSYLETSGTP
ncbi:protein AF-9 isoform X1 [Arapaima gigas]